MADPIGTAQVDQALVARVLLTEDRRAFEELVKRYQGLIRAQLRQLLHGDAAKADDLAQETFLLAWRKLHQFRGEARFSTWLHRIAYSCFLQSRRKKTLEMEKVDFDALDEPATLQDPVELRIDVGRAMLCLSEFERIVLLHVVQLGLSHDEAAHVLELPLGTVKSHTARGKAKLRKLLSDWRSASREDDPQ